MTKEDIDKAAISSIRKHYRCAGSPPCSELENCRFCSGKNTAYDCNECGADEFLEGFLIAANWRINTAWHDATEVPKKKGYILVWTKFFGFVTWNVNVEPAEWNKICKDNQVVEWAYIEDLIPNKED